MDKPSKSWQAVRHATLNRVRRRAIEPLVPLYTTYSAVCVCYLVGFIRFQFFDARNGFTWIDTTQLAIVTIAGALVPILTGAMLIFLFVSRTLANLENE